MKYALRAASLVLVAGSTVACGGDGGDGGAGGDGGDGGAPSDASTADFCGVFEDFYAAALKLGAEAEDTALIETIKQTGEDLDEVGTPEDIPADARAGFELTVQMLADLDPDASQEELEKMEEGLSDEEQKQSDAFDKYLDETCEDPSEQAPEELPTDLPTEEPSS